jgi:hypothetical protein
MAMRWIFCLVLAAAWSVAPLAPAQGAISFIGKGSIPGSARDNLGLTDPIDANGTPQNLLGGLGSGLAYTGFGNTYIATPDRGPADGASTYLDRYYRLRIDINPVAKTVTPKLLSTHLLSKGPAFPGQIFTGNAGAFDAANSPASLRFDPEGVRVGRTGTIFISDEYGPFVYEFDAFGNRRRSLTIPPKFLITPPGVPNADPAVELTNPSGRQPNRGMEGLAINPQGTKLYGMMQNALIQDNALDSNLKRVGKNNRLLEIDLSSGATREFLYQLDDKSNGVNEIVAVNDHEFLVLERDGKAGSSAKFKKIFKIDIAGATDISGIASLPKSGVPAGVTPAAKELFLDLLDPQFGLAGDDFPEKIEGLAFGPLLPDGRLPLLVTSDNDFLPDNPSVFYAFAIDAGELNYQPQVVVPVPTALFLLAGGLLRLAARRRAAR